MDWCCCLMGWMCLGNLLESCHPVTLMELILHSSSRGVPRWHPVQCQAMSSVCAELWGCLCLLWEEGSGGWPRSLSPAWCLAALDGACLAQTGPFCTGFTPFPDFHLAKTRARIFFFCNSCLFFLSPWCSQAASLKFLFHFQVLAGGTELTPQGCAFLSSSKTGLEEYVLLKGSHSSSWSCSEVPAN